MSPKGHKASTTSGTVTLTGTEVVYGHIDIRDGGASKLKHPAVCTTSSGNAAATRGVNRVYKVMAVPGAVAVLAGALA
jgi:hypothetical protein